MEHNSMLPFDNIKTHSQIKQYESFRYSQIVRVIFNSGSKGTFLHQISQFWKGGALVSMGCGPAHAAFFSVHEFNKQKIMNLDEKFRPLYFAIGGGIACITHDLVMTPFDAMKQRSQILHGQKNSQIFLNMLKNEGVYSFYRSFPVTLLMNIPWNGLMIMTNETLKPYINEEQSHSFFTFFLCAGFASFVFNLGFVASVMTMPLDNIKTRL